MPNNKKNRNRRPAASHVLSVLTAEADSAPEQVPGIIGYLHRKRVVIGVVSLSLLLGLGVFAKNGWLPSTDPLSGKRTGWFGKPLAKNAASSWNPLVLPTATPTPQLSKEYLYAGTQLLAVEDANAGAAPPADLAVWRGSNGYFYVLGGPGSTQTYYPWGTSGDTPVPGDYDGDGKTDFAIVRPNAGAFDWYIAYSGGGSTSLTFGASTDLLSVGDYDGDGKSDISVWRPSTGVYYIRKSSDSSTTSTSFGTSTDIPAPADFDGDGRTDMALWNNSSHTYYWVESSTATSRSASFGAASDKPVPADYDGDGKADLAIWRDSNNSWYVKQSTDGQTIQYAYGASTDIRVQNDYDGDGKVDIAIWRPSTGVWWIRQSHDGSTRNETWGASGDIPVPAYYRR